MPELELNRGEAFLRQVADGLPFDEAEKLDILRELASHLADSTSRFESEGLTLDEAEKRALDRLGPPDRLAVELTHARRTPRRLLAAAGAGTWAAVSGVVYGYLFGLLVLVGASFVTIPLAAGVVRLFGGSWGSLLDNTAMTLLALVGYWLYPLAPPRLMPGGGFVDTVRSWGTWGVAASEPVTSASNQYAAMPSMHVGWALWCGVIVARHVRRPAVQALGCIPS